MALLIVMNCLPIFNYKLSLQIKKLTISGFIQQHNFKLLGLFLSFNGSKIKIVDKTRLYYID